MPAAEASKAPAFVFYFIVKIQKTPLFRPQLLNKPGFFQKNAKSEISGKALFH